MQQTLESFEIPGEVSGYTSGPRVTRFEITLAPGVNVKKVEQIADNIAMNLAATSVRVLAPIPGRPVVGVEVSNTKSEAVFMRTVMESDAWQKGKADIPIALGKDVIGDKMTFVKENDMVKLISYNGNVFSMEPPMFVELEITETEPGFKGNTATGATKPATVETGATVSVPLFCNIGDVIKIDTRTGDYLSRA